MTELFVDTNIVLRLLTNEPRDLADRAVALLNEADVRRLKVVLTSVTLAEAVYVLESVYARARGHVAGELIDVIASDIFVVPERAILIQALLWYRDIARLDFADAYVASVAHTRTDAAVLSFDRGMRRISGIRMIDRPEELAR